MKDTRSIRLPLNRVEGDLEIHIETRDGIVTDARSVGTMYRGFENLLKGRASLDGLVITPRICGICSTAHLKAAAKALDALFNVEVPGNGKRVRNVTLMIEQMQNDIRHTFLLFAPDFTRSAYTAHPLFNEAIERYLPLKGVTAIQAINETRRILEIVAILGGQWPHSSFMVPGGVVSVVSHNEINQCRYLVANFRKWYEHRVLGCDLERWHAVKSPEDLERWLQEADAHRDGDLGFFIRFARQAGMSAMGGGHGNFLSFGALDMPHGTSVTGLPGCKTYFPSGFVTGGEFRSFDPEKITEDITCSRFTGYTQGRHPFDGVTTPDWSASGLTLKSWAKAPRYEGLPAETGPLAEFVVAGDPLFTGFLSADGPNVLVRQLARLTRPAAILPAIDMWLKEIATSSDIFYKDYEPCEKGTGYGLTQAHRGALGHWVKIEDGKIALYQVITPTAWNASPRDTYDVRGPLEQALVGTYVADPDDPIEVEHVVRSFDPCLVCTVHTIEGKRTYEPGPTF